MKELRPGRRPTFLWQGSLIVLPVVFLAIVGFFSLRQDRVLAQHEATQRAQAIADALVPRLWSEVIISNVMDLVGADRYLVAEFLNTTPPALNTVTNSSAEAPRLLLVREGQLIRPVPSEPLPTPRRLETESLDAGQAQLWRTAQQAEANGRAVEALDAYGQFTASNPPEQFRAAAQYSFGLLLAAEDKTAEAIRVLKQLAGQRGDCASESGLPYQVLAELKLLDMPRLQSEVSGVIAGSPQVLCSNLVAHPSPMTGEFLRRVFEKAHDPDDKEAVRRWQHIWARDEVSRELFTAARAELAAATASDSLFWIEAPEGIGEPDTSTNGPSGSSGPWLFTRLSSTPEGTWFACRPESEMRARLESVLWQNRQIPEYFGVGVEIAGRPIKRFAPGLQIWREAEYMTKGGGGLKKEYLPQESNEILASAFQGQAGREQLRVRIYLTSPTALFKTHRVRTFWFGSLIAVAAGAGFVGLVAAYRAFHRQLRLGQMKSNFVSSVSHELRAPIGSMRLMAETLERGKIADPARQHEYFHFIVQECRRLSSLIENVLDFSRIEQGRKQYDLEPTDMVALTKETVALMETYGAERQVRFAISIPDAQIPALSSQPVLDGKAIQQALVNLAENALKHSPKGETITIGLEIGRSEDHPPDPETTTIPAHTKVPAVGWALGEPTPGPVIRLWVEDHGEGIPREEHIRIFERFYRRGSELRRQTQGVGIGLSIVKHIVEAHGGRVLLRSAPGKGSRFTLELPFSPNDKPAEGSPSITAHE